MYGTHYKLGAASMISLKSRLPSLAAAPQHEPCSSLREATSLGSGGLLEVRPGRGPGSGVPLTAESLATLLISVVATTSLSEVEAQTRFIGRLKSTEGICPRTGKRTFGAALAAILSAEDMYGVSTITVERRGQAAQAMMVYRSESR